MSNAKERLERFLLSCDRCGADGTEIAHSLICDDCLALSDAARIKDLMNRIATTFPNPVDWKREKELQIHQHFDWSASVCASYTSEMLENAAKLASPRDDPDFDPKTEDWFNFYYTQG
jgi:hypothetical protein